MVGITSPETKSIFLFSSFNSFSFNSPYGMCNQCKGLGYVNEVNIDSLIPDKNKSIYSGGITAVGSYKNNWMFSQLKNISNKYKFDLKDPIKDIPQEALNIILYGGKEKFKIMSKSLGLTRTYNIDFEGIVSFINNQFSFSESKKLKSWAKNFMLKSKLLGLKLRPPLFQIFSKKMSKISFFSSKNSDDNLFLIFFLLIKSWV